MEIGNFETSVIKRNPIKGIFGIILYSRANPYMIKVLRDNDFWNAIDENSGKLFPIFSIKPSDGTYQKEENDEPRFDYLVPVWKEPEENIKLLNELGISDTKSLPMFLIYAEIDEKQFYSAFKIKSESIDSTFKSINEICTILDETVEKFDAQNMNNNESLYRETTGNIEYLLTWKKVSSGYDLFNKIRSFTKIF